MGERTSYVPGTPSWVDMGTADTAAAAEFYRQVLGWDVEWAADPDAGGYGMFLLRGKRVAGIGPQTDLEAPPYWMVYMTVADADAGAATVVTHGGAVVAGPFDVFDAGRMAVCQDPEGTFFSVWQPMSNIGAELVNEVGAFCWNELATSDLPRSSAFYRAVFGWELSADEMPSGSEIYLIDGQIVCGAHTAGDGEYPSWSIWFTVEDCDATAAQIAELGGAVHMPPTDMSFGRGAVVADPQGAVFGIAGVAEPDP